MQDWGPPHPDFDYPEYLDFLVRHNHNFMRMWNGWMGRIKAETFMPSSPMPWARTGPGTAADGRPKFDLGKFDQAYFDRLRARVILAGDRGIYVGVMLWVPARYGRAWTYNPYHPANNVNGIDGDPNGDGVPDEVQTREIAGLWPLQQAYVRKFVDTLNDLDNIVWEVINEDRRHSLQWQYDVINYIKTYEETKPRSHPVGMTTTGGGKDAITNAELLASPADWISPREREPGYAYSKDPPVATGGKVIVVDTDHITVLGTTDPVRARVVTWTNFLRGNNFIVMDAIQNPLPNWEAKSWSDPANPAFGEFRRAQGHTRAYSLRLNLAQATPQNRLSSTAFCLAAVGVEYLVYQPMDQSFTVNLTAGTYAFEWFNPTTGSVAGTGSFMADSGDRSFSAPFRGEAVLYLKSAPDSMGPPSEAAPRTAR